MTWQISLVVNDKNKYQNPSCFFLLYHATSTNVSNFKGCSGDASMHILIVEKKNHSERGDSDFRTKITQETAMTN